MPTSKGVHMSKLPSMLNDPESDHCIRWVNSYKIYFNWEKVREFYSIPTGEHAFVHNLRTNYRWVRSCACSEDCVCVFPKKGYWMHRKLKDGVYKHISQIPNQRTVKAHLLKGKKYIKRNVVPVETSVLSKRKNPILTSSDLLPCPPTKIHKKISASIDEQKSQPPAQPTPSQSSSQFVPIYPTSLPPAVLASKDPDVQPTVTATATTPVTMLPPQNTAKTQNQRPFHFNNQNWEDIWPDAEPGKNNCDFLKKEDEAEESKKNERTTELKPSLSPFTNNLSPSSLLDTKSDLNPGQSKQMTMTQNNGFSIFYPSPAVPTFLNMPAPMFPPPAGFGLPFTPTCFIRKDGFVRSYSDPPPQPISNPSHPL